MDGDFSTTIWERFGEAPEDGDRSMSQKPVLGANFQFAEDLPNDLRDTRSVGAYRGSQPIRQLYTPLISLNTNVGNKEGCEQRLTITIIRR